jgi:5-methylcytosine-specific restriction endonuclease McrA
MGHRSGKEFPDHIIDAAWRRAGCECEQCGSKEDLEGDHILALWYAAEYFPQLSSWVLKSLENCRVLCHNCHVKKHRHEDYDEYNRQALVLLQMMGRDFF